MTLFCPSSTCGGVWCGFDSDTLTWVSTLSKNIPKAQIQQQTIPPKASSRFVVTQRISQIWSKLAGNMLNVLSATWNYATRTDYISKTIFRSGGMAPSEWTRSIRAFRDTPVVDFPAHSDNTTRRLVDRPPIAVSLSLHVLSVSYFKWSLSRCVQLWQYVGMGSLGTRLHRDCNAMCDPVNISPRVPSTCAQNAILSILIILIIPGRQIYVAIDNPSLVLSVSCVTTSSYLWNDVCAANNISHAEILQSNSCRCFSHLYKFRDRIQVTRVFRYCGERQG